MESVTGLIWIICVCVSAPVVVLSELLPVIRESEAYTLTYISRRDLEEDEWTETQNVLITPGIPTQYDSTVSHEAIYHVISNALLSPSFSSLNPYTISNVEYYNSILETYSNHDTNKWKSDNNEIFDEILAKISRYNETQLLNYSTPLEPGQFGTVSGIYIDIQRIPLRWIERNDIQDTHSNNSIDLTISNHYQRTSTGNVHFDGIPDAKSLNSQLTSGLPHVTVMTSFPTERSFSRTLTSTYVDTLGQSQSLYTRMASSSSFLQSQEPMKTDLPTLTPYHVIMMTGRTSLTYSSTGVMKSYRWVFPEEVTNRLSSQDQYYEIFVTNGQSQETRTPNLFTGLSQPETSFSMASITGSSTFIQLQENTPILPPVPPKTMTVGTHIVSYLLDTTILSLPSSGQYKLMEDAVNLRPSKGTFSIFLFTEQWLSEIKSSMTSMASSSKSSAHQANIPISSQPPPEIMTAGTNRSELSDHTIKTRLSLFEQYQFIENTATLESPQKTLSNSLLNGLSWPDVEDSMSNIRSSATPSQYQSNTAMLQPLLQESEKYGTHEFWHSLATIIPSSFEQYQPAENRPTYWPSQEKVPTILLTGLSQSNIESNTFSIISLVSPAQFQSNTARLPPSPPDRVGSHRLGLSLEPLKINLFSFGQHEFADNTPTLRSFQETSSPRLFTPFSQPEIQSIITRITSSFVLAPIQANTPILPTPPIETTTIDTHRFESYVTTIANSLFPFEQYIFTENKTTVRSSQEIFSSRLFTGLWQQEIQSSMTSIINSASTAQFQSNITIFSPATQEAMTTDTHRFRNSLVTIITKSSSFGQNQLIKTTSSLRSSQETMPTSLISEPEIQSGMTSVITSSTPTSLQINMSILSSPSPEIKITGEQRFWPTMETILNSSFVFQQYRSIENITTKRFTLDVLSANLFTVVPQPVWSSFIQYHFIENKTILRSSKKTFSTNLFHVQSQPESQRNMTIITSSSMPALYQNNTPLTTTTAGIDRLALSLLTISSPSFGQYQPVENTPNIERSQGTLSVSFFTVILEPRFQSRMTGITSVHILDQSSTETSILPSQPPETMSAGTHSLGLSLQTLKTSMSSQDILSIILFTGQSQPETQGIFTSIASLSMSMQVNTSILPSSPPAIKTAVTNMIRSSLETIIPSSFSFGQYEFIETSPALRPAQESLSTNLFTGPSHPEYESIIASITRLSMSAQFHVKTPLFLPPSFEIMIAGTQIFGNALKSLILSSSSLEQYQSIQNKPTLQYSQETLSTNVLAVLSQPWIQTSMTNITSSSTPAPFKVNTPILPLPSSEKMINMLWPSVDIIITSSFAVQQYGFVANTTTVRSSEKILSVSFFTGLTQREIQSNMPNIASLYTHTQLQEKSARLSPSPPETNPTDTYKFRHSLMTIITNSSSFAQYQFTENTIRLSQKTLSTNLFNGLWQPEIQSSMANITSLSTPAPIQVNKPIFMPPPLETMIAGTRRLDLSLKTMITSPFSLGKYQFKENTRTLMPYQGTLSTYLQSETMLMSMEFISNVSVANTTRLSTSDSYSNTIQQYYFIYPSIGSITTSHIDTVVNVSHSSASSLSSRLNLLPSLPIKESKAIEDTTDRSSASKQK
ncbi:hypothetical protein CHS0354_027094 [Potamilus streckersoni]|uniref:Uncharacterized protein n=1 Tax=Potamilus streckersoni TaxID=2493646 RepID=A0AAE0S0D1_9BIVA|nr:hypothetical protein CHS0354_027094 [Potamilus streckersoni]